MAVSNDQIIDLLYKQAFGVTKTDTETNKSPSNESIPSPLLNRGDTLWTQADQIPGTATATAGIVQAYTGANAVECVADNTTVPISGVYPTWKTNLTYWIPTEFGSTYQVQVWVDNSGVANPTSTGTQIFADGSGGTGQWYFNYQSGVLNFIGETIPAALTSGKVLYIVGYRYIGKTGVTDLPSNVTIGNLQFDNVTISTTVANANIELAPNGTGVVNSTANIVAPSFIGNFSGNVTISASNTQVVYSANGSAVGSNAFVFDYASNVLTLNGNLDVSNADLGNLVTANYANIANDINVLGSLNGNIGNFSGNINSLNANLGNLIEANFVQLTDNLTSNNATINLELVANTANFSGNVILPNLTVNNELVGNTANFSGNVIVPNLNVNLELAGNTANFSGNVILPNLTVNSQLAGNTANFTGNISAANAALGNLVTANYVNVANDLNVIGNVNAGNFVGTFANGNSNVKIYGNANVEISVAGNANVATVTGAGFLVAGNIQATTGNVLANGNVTANGFLVGANASVTGEANVGSLKTANITATSQNISITAGANGTIELTPNGTGTVDVNNFRITQVADPVDPKDATNKEYVDALAGEGLVIHTPVRVETPTALTATYAQGGTTPTVTDIVNGTDIVFSASHGLSVNDGIVFANTFNGLTAGEAYWVYSVANSTAITVKDGYFGAQVTGLTNGTGLTQGSRANPGVGATLTNAGANAALTIDGISVANNDRVLVYTQSNAFENGIYDVTDSGNGSAQWILTRSTDFDTYIPGSSVGVGKGSYVFVTQGLTGAGESYVMTAPAGEVIIGTDNVTFTQFSAAGSYSAGNGINITGSIISANTDGVTTDIVSGNIVVKASANLTTPNIGDATFQSLTWTSNGNGNVTANNLSISNVANITGDLTVAANIQANGTISSNANISGLNLTTSGNVDVGANILANNITSNNWLNGASSNISGNLTASNVTINVELSGNTANFSGNVVSNNFTVNLELSGNTANFSTSVRTPLVYNGNSNIALAANSNITIAAAGTSVITVAGDASNVSNNQVVIIGNVKPNGIWTDNYYYANGAPVDFQQPAGSNTEIQFNSNGDFGASNAFTFDTSANTLTVSGNANITTVNTSNLIGTGTNVTINANGFVSTFYGADGNVDFPAFLDVADNVSANWFVGNFQGNFTAPGSNTEILFNNSNVTGTSANLTFDFATQVLTVTGNIDATNIDAGNLLVANFANIADNVVANNATINLELSANTANFSGNVVLSNLTVNTELAGNAANFSAAVVVSALTVNNDIGGNTANFSGNVILPNLTVNLELVGNTANFSGNVILPNLTVNNELAGNTANFSGNVIVPNLAVNLELTGNTANFSGNVVVPNLTVNTELYGNFANFTSNIVSNNSTVNLELTGNTANFSGNVILPNLTVNSELVGNTANFSGNVILPNLTVNSELAGNTANFSGNVILPNLTVNLELSGNTANFSGNVLVTKDFTANNITSNNIVEIGNSVVGWGNLTTTAITANQTIVAFAAASVTGVEYLVKGVDSTGAKYSVATVQAVTDGTDVDYVTYGTAFLGGTTGTLAVNIDGSNIALQVTPASSNSTAWIVQYRTI